MPVLLVNTNRMQPPIAPLALDYIGAALESAGHEIRLLDFCLVDDAESALESVVDDGEPDLVAVTFRNTDDCYFASQATFTDILRDDVALLRKHFAGPLVLGGGGVSIMPVEILDYVHADYAVCGDGEPALPELLRALNGDVSTSAVPGLVYREEGRWVLNDPSRADMNALDLSARSVVDNRTYFTRGGQVGIETKRGCPGSCIYCADPVIKGRSSRLRPAAQVVNEIRNLLAQGVDCFHLCDSEFNMPVSHALDLCDAIIDAGLEGQMRWYTYASPSPFTETLVRSMQHAGCAGIDFGVDSGSDRMLKALGRPYDVRAVEETARICHACGMTFMYDLLLGGPGETPATLAETVALMQKIKPDRVGVSLGVRVYPGTALAESIGEERDGLVGRPGGLEPYFYVSPALGEDPAGLVQELVGADERFFVPGGGDDQDYNYNDNTVLTDAIRKGHRGAFWDILRKLQEGIPPDVAL